MEANLDYEKSLVTGKKGSLQLARSWDWLIPWIEGKVYDQSLYQKDYLKQIQKYRELQFVPSEARYPWWGSLQNLEKERLLNSKQTSLKCKHELRINDLGEDQKILLDQKYLLKPYFGFVGKGIKIVPGSFLKDMDLKDYTYSPIISRVLDFSTWGSFLESKLLLNLVDSRFQYKGSILPPQDIQKLLSPFYRDKKIRNYYQKLGAQDLWGVDYFLSKEYPEQAHFSEVNYRKTMGFVCLKLQDILQKKNDWFSMVIGFPQNRTDSKCLKISPQEAPLEFHVLWDQDPKELTSRVNKTFFFKTSDDFLLLKDFDQSFELIRKVINAKN